MSLSRAKVCRDEAAFKEDPSFVILQDTLTNVPLKMMRPFGITPNNKFHIDLGDLPIQDQNASGRCWIFAGVNVLRRLMMKHYGKKKGARITPDFKLSPAFVFTYAWLEKCNSALETAFEFINKDSLPSAEFKLVSEGILTDGGTWDAFLELVNKYGIVPEYAFPDTTPAKYSKEINDVIKSIVNISIGEMLIEKRQSDARFTRTSFEMIKKNAMTKVHKALCAMLGTPPSSFLDREGLHKPAPKKGSSKRTSSSADAKTPLDYYLSVVKPCLQQSPDFAFACLTDDPRQPSAVIFSTQYTYTVLPDKLPYTTLGHLPSNIFFNLGKDKIKTAAIKALKAGWPLWFSCDVNKYYDAQRLLLNSRAVNNGILEGDDIWSMPKTILYDCGAVQNAHAMTLIGYDDNEKQWKVENSWGQSAHMVMTDKWFDIFVVCVVVPLQFLEHKDRKAYTERLKDVHTGIVVPMVPVWDIFSSPQKIEK